MNKGGTNDKGWRYWNWIVLRIDLKCFWAFLYFKVRKKVAWPGLSLWTVKKIVEHLNGSIKISSDPKLGTKIDLNFDSEVEENNLDLKKRSSS